MDENKSNSQSQTKTIVALILLVAVLFLGIKLIFKGLEAVMPEVEDPGTTWYQLYEEGGQAASYDMRPLEAEERQAEDVAKWLQAAGDYIAQNRDGDKSGVAFWLYRQDTDEYILYLPTQDRTVFDGGMTATEEKDEEGNVTLVLRIRTPEDGEEVVPEEQLLCVVTDSQEWNGIRLKVILDGREQSVYTLTSKGEKLYSTEEAYIGRN